MDASQLSPQMIVHLVHGTWPYGFFRRKRSSKPAWFEPNSDFRRRIGVLSGEKLFYEPFSWSGRNSYKDRLAAGRLFREKLHAWIRAYPQAKHVIIAHSHGGTVAAIALAENDGIVTRQSVPWLVCMATPFAYAISATREQKKIFCVALATVIAVFLLFFFPHFSPSLTKQMTWDLVFVFVAASVLFSVFIRSTALDDLYGKPEATVERVVPTFLLRATRDEAALSIGLAQSLNWLMSQPQKWWASGRWGRILIPLALEVPPLILPMLLAKNHISLYHLSEIVFFFIPASLCLLYIAGYLGVAIAAGFFEFCHWPSTIVEVDVAPPWWSSVVRIVAVDDTSQADLRHGLHSNENVRSQISSLILWALGRMPVDVVGGKHKTHPNK